MRLLQVSPTKTTCVNNVTNYTLSLIHLNFVTQKSKSAVIQQEFKCNFFVTTWLIAFKHHTSLYLMHNMEMRH